MAKYKQITRLLKARIDRGDYQVRPFPSVTRLARELEINRRTAAKAMDTLVADGLLLKSTTGRIAPAAEPNPKTLSLGVLVPAYPSPVVASRFRTIEQATHRRGWDVKLVGYHHVDDPVVYEAIAGFDALFVLPLTETGFPDDVVSKLKATGTKAVSLVADMTHHGLPCLSFENLSAVTIVLDHLYGLGHRRIACINTQHRRGNIIARRIARYTQWKRGRGVEGPLIDEPVQIYEDTASKAYEVVRRCLEDKRLDGVDAIFCVTGVALGVYRALADFGMVPGREIAVAAADDGQVGRLLVPSLTAPISSPEAMQINACLDWFASDDPEWPGPLLVQGDAPTLFVGESTDPPRETENH